MCALDGIPSEGTQPTVIVAHTVKGKGISFLENKASCHFWTPSKEELRSAITEVEEKIRKMQEELGVEA